MVFDPDTAERKANKLAMFARDYHEEKISLMTFETLCRIAGATTTEIADLVRDYKPGRKNA